MQSPHELDEALVDAAPADLLRAVGLQAARLAATIADLDEAQWQSPPRTGSGVPRGATGTYSDPTADTVTDAQRLRLRASVIAAERTLREAAVSCAVARSDLDEVSRPYVGNKSTGA